MSLFDSIIQGVVSESDLAGRLPQLDAALRDALAETEKASLAVTVAIEHWRKALTQVEPLLTAAGVKLEPPK